ncbi:cytochrome protein [Elsinoe ampelina]|uniref:Cytochrome protein n=1 Tax=Elsinoe ampelina TaxID=302913 RepID=A0A6A6G127_9PEZI|nr:cytochrome protein [Elsinoe ampelina]
MAQVVLSSIGLAFIGGLGFVLFRIVQNIFFHPLSRSPGPLLARITNLWAVWHGWRGDLAHTLAVLHTKHGEFVRFGPNRLSINSSEALEKIYGFKANTLKSKQWYLNFAADPRHPATNTEVDPAQHKRKRAFLNKGFTSTNMKLLEPKILDVVENWKRHCIVPKNVDGSEKDDGWSTPRDMANWSVYLTNDVMGAVVFSKSFQLSENEEHRWLAKAVPLSTRSKYAGCFAPWLITNKLDRFLYPSLTSWRLKLRAFSMDQLNARVTRKDDKSLHDFFRYLLDARDPDTNEPLDARTLGSESNLLVGAGGDTTSTAIAGTFFFLCQNGGPLATLKAELHERFSSVDDIVPGPALDDCKYLRACIDEAMRLAPPAPSPLMREVQGGGLTIHDQHLPPGTEVAVTTFALHRHPEHFPDPLKYKPERWIPSLSSEEETKKAKEAFAPFSMGPRQCIGMRLAYLEAMVTIGRVVFEYEIRSAKGMEKVGEDKDGLYELLDSFGTEKKGPWVEFKRR